MPPSSKRKLPMEDDKPGSGPLEKTDAGEKNPAEVPAPSERPMPNPLTWVPTLQDMASSFGLAALILLLHQYKEIITMVVDAKIAELVEEKNKSAVPERTDNTNVVEDAGGGEAGSSSTEAPRTSAKLAATQDQTRHRRAIIENRRTASWMARRVSSGSVVTCRNDPDLQQKSKPVSVWSTRRSVTKPPSIPEVPKAGLSESARSPMRRPDSTGCVVATRGE